MGTTITERAGICADTTLIARVEQAIAEAGKQQHRTVARAVADIVRDSTIVGANADEPGELTGASITDEEIIAYVETL